MADSMAEQLTRDVECEGLLECVHGLTELDEACYRTLVESEELLTIDEDADRVDRERSTAYRSIQRLLETGFVRKEQVNYEQGGHYHVYYPTDAVHVASDVRRLLDEWYAKMGQLVREFEDTYGRQSGGPASVEG